MIYFSNAYGFILYRMNGFDVKWLDDDDRYQSTSLSEYQNDAFIK